MALSDKQCKRLHSMSADYRSSGTNASARQQSLQPATALGAVRSSSWPFHATRLTTSIATSGSSML